MVNELQAWAKSRGYKITWGDTSVLTDVRKRINALKQSGELDEVFYKNQLSWIENPKELDFPNPKSVIVVAVPRPAHRLTFELKNAKLDTVLPPTYVAYSRTFEKERKDIVSSVLTRSYRVDILQAPLKSVAALLGFVSYGRNNITYIPGLGSYYQLVGLITDAVLPNSPAVKQQQPSSCPECNSCRICFKACPSGAIDEERFLIRAERCFVLYNENPGPWPEWLKPSLQKCFSADSCLVGCLACQKVCPMNKGLLEFEDAEVSFTAEETDAILSGFDYNSNSIGNGISEKLNRLGLSEEYRPCLGRNFRELLNHRRLQES